MPSLTPAQTLFRDRVCRLARRIAPRYRVPWRIMAAAAILESGWNESDQSIQLYNYFNLRSVRTGRFRKFRSMAESFHAFGRAFSTLPASPDPDYAATLVQIIALLTPPVRSHHAHQFAR
jgi:flagellum-specific peptidoglycan hydrolase FlgJ